MSQLVPCPVRTGVPMGAPGGPAGLLSAEMRQVAPPPRTRPLLAGPVPALWGRQAEVQPPRPATVQQQAPARALSPGGPPRAASAALLHAGAAFNAWPAPVAQPTPVAGPPRPMADGEVVTIGRRQFLVGEVIGEGAYARVWSARCASQEEAAIKEMRCGQGPGILPDASLQRAMFEVEVMVRLASEEVASSASTSTSPFEVCAPRVLEHQFWQLGPSTPAAYLCRVAMTRRPGKPLGAWLDARIARKVSYGPARGDEDEVMMYLSSFLDAACVARALLAQLGPTFEKLNSHIAIHRDVNARNLLVYSPADSDPEDHSAGAAPSDASLLEFSVVDFGSSTDAKAWLGTGEGSWHMENPTGDARYWGPANWIRFLGGAQALSQEPGLLRIYSRRLDMFALAICALQVLLELHTRECPSELDLQDPHGDRNAAVHMVHMIQQVRSSWSSYWTIAVRSFDRLAEYSRLVCCGEQQRAAQLWQELSSGCIPQMLGQTLHELCDDLVALSDLCQLQRGGNGHSSWVQVGQTLAALRDMTHDDSSIDWAELCARIGPAVRRRPGDPRGVGIISGPNASGGASVDAEPGNSVVTSAACGGAPSVVAAAGTGASITTSAAPSPPNAVAPSLASRMMPGHPVMQQQAAMFSAPRATPSGGTAPAVQMRLVAEISGSEAAAGHLAAPVMQQPQQQPQVQPQLQQQLHPQTLQQAQQQPALGMQSREATETEAFEEDIGAEANGAATPSVRSPQASATAAGADEWGLQEMSAAKESAGSSRRLDHRMMPTSAFSPNVVTPPSTLQQLQQPSQAAELPAGASDSPPLTPLALSQLRNQLGMPLQERYTQESADRRSRSVAPLSNPQSPGEGEREHEALRILRQVESEVRTLKRWYTEAIEAMRSPPFPAWGAQPPQPGSPAYGMGPGGPPGSDSAAGAAAAAAAAAVAAQLPGIAGTSIVAGPSSTAAGGGNVVPTPPVGYLQGPMPMGSR